mmetsp:Transcript_29233/g.44048  ORF Transcript_29233/g.44048 Transcript_29233/m.44048 type:complete len:89 (+) Transcript_29233:114-380(+)
MYFTSMTTLAGKHNAHKQLGMLILMSSANEIQKLYTGLSKEELITQKKKRTQSSEAAALHSQMMEVAKNNTFEDFTAYSKLNKDPKHD